MVDMARSNYEPRDDAAKLFRQQKRIIDDQAKIKDPLRDMAIREMREAGATVGDLAKWTGLSAEYFRRIAREAGIERKREPTVRRLKDDD
ncbi:hypothetical protein ACIOWI_29625 [Streptomyces sp. NPDC087659]|uniref:hypothetical protein n=1 Tax=Streptomyces sp. NPDC087659 TaxID=3365801 RepID=UPI003810557A